MVEDRRVTAAVRGATDADWLHRAAHEAQLRGAALQLLGVRNVLGWAADSALLPGSRAQESVRQGEQETQALAAGIRQRFPGLRSRRRSRRADPSPRFWWRQVATVTS
ncbi:hypothetical protein ACFPN0_31805 [Kitasatospora cinereorecta]